MPTLLRSHLHSSTQDHRLERGFRHRKKGLVLRRISSDILPCGKIAAGETLDHFYLRPKPSFDSSYHTGVRRQKRCAITIKEARHLQPSSQIVKLRTAEFPYSKANSLSQPGPQATARRRETAAG